MPPVFKGGGFLTWVAMLTVVIPLLVPVSALGIYPSIGLALSMHPAKEKKTGAGRIQHIQVPLTSSGVT